MAQIKQNLSIFENMVRFDMISFKKFKKQHDDAIDSLIINNPELSFEEQSKKITAEDVKYMYIMEALLESIISGYKICCDEEIDAD